VGLVARGFFYVLENKIVAGRGERAEGDAVGRSIAVAFYERAPGDVVRRVDRESLGVRPRLLTIAELLLLLGAVAPLEAATPAEKEAALEESVGALDLRRFRGILESAADEPHVYSLEEEGNAEDVFLTESPFEALTKIALARAIERALGEPRRANWAQSLEFLRGRARPLLHPEVVPAPKEVPASTRGRGRGRDGQGRRRARGA
jgi:hypothetical protein